MGKRLISQRRGRGTPVYRARSHYFKGEVKHFPQEGVGQVIGLVHCAGHTAPLMNVAYSNGQENLAFAPEHIRVGDSVTSTITAVLSDPATQAPLVLKEGSVLALKDLPEGTLIHNIELRPGDGGKLVRASGTFARVVAKSEGIVRVLLPSRKEKVFHPNCRAAVCVIAGSGRPEKPFLKAGARFWKMKARGKLYPHVCGISMNAVDHPFGGKCSHIKGRPTQSPRNAPPGRKVGKIAPRRTGRKR